MFVCKWPWENPFNEIYKYYYKSGKHNTKWIDTIFNWNIKYRPPNSDASYNEGMCKAFEEISNSNKNAVIWIGGDFNLPDINWNSMAVNGNHNLLQMNNRFLEMIQNCNLDQVVKFPTRLDNTLDLFLTNRPSLINRCTHSWYCRSWHYFHWITYKRDKKQTNQEKKYIYGNMLTSVKWRRIYLTL